MLHQNLFFRVFLFMYGGFVISHIWSTGFSSWHLYAWMTLGATVALFTHKQHGYMPLALLVCHMIVEWCSHALHGNHYSQGELVFHGIHAVLDFVFLSVEAREHCGKYAVPFLGAVIALIVGIVWYNYVPAPKPLPENLSPLIAQALEVQRAMQNHSHNGGILYHIVIGGILGCIASHMLIITQHKHAH